MRILPFLAFTVLLSTSAMAQDATRAFTGSAAAEARACAIAKAEAQAWVKQGKAEGRRRTLLEAGDCACTTTDDSKMRCRIEARVRDEAYEEEEEAS
jgi:hypothetical protein